jgi:hypothetical protein
MFPLTSAKLLIDDLPIKSCSFFRIDEYEYIGATMLAASLIEPR